MASPATKLSPEHISYTVETLISFASAATSLPIEKVREIHKRSGALLGEIREGKIDPTTACGEVKKIIRELNAELPKDHAPYPPLATDLLENQVKNHIIAFELFLNQKLKSGELTLEQESPLFSDSLTLWRDVGGKLTAREGIQRLSRLIAKANSYLSEKNKFPLPDPTKYS